MMKIISIRKIYILLLLTIVFSSCKKEEIDIEKPVISNLKIGENNEAILYKSEVIYLEFDASDNSELANYKISISKSAKGDPASETGWEFSKIYNIPSGKTTYKVINQQITVPTDALSANYNFTITLYDRSGNYFAYTTVVPLISE
ncbi:MAG: DUF4625 domain-containing protein [Bacteroidales bacterium]|nr:DUF4625 domain-containing protein [Bacteroidales bacterium]